MYLQDDKETRSLGGLLKKDRTTGMLGVQQQKKWQSKDLQ